MIIRTEANPAPAGIFKRMLAYILDIIILVPTTLLAAFLMGFIMQFIVETPLIFHNTRTGTVITTLSYILYFCISESSWRQSSPGKKYLGLHVARKGGERLTFMRSLFRILTCWLLIFCGLIPAVYFLPSEGTVKGIFGGIGVTLYSIMCILLYLFWPYITVFFTKEKKTVYDMLTGTRVYARPKAEVGESSIEMEPARPPSASPKTLPRRRKK